MTADREDEQRLATLHFRVSTAEGEDAAGVFVQVAFEDGGLYDAVETDGSGRADMTLPLPAHGPASVWIAVDGPVVCRTSIDGDESFDFQL